MHNYNHPQPTPAGMLLFMSFIILFNLSSAYYQTLLFPNIGLPVSEVTNSSFLFKPLTTNIALSSSSSSLEHQKTNSTNHNNSLVISIVPSNNIRECISNKDINTIGSSSGVNICISSSGHRGSSSDLEEEEEEEEEVEEDRDGGERMRRRSRREDIKLAMNESSSDLDSNATTSLTVKRKWPKSKSINECKEVEPKKAFKQVCNNLKYQYTSTIIL